MPVKKIEKRSVSDEVLAEFDRLISSGEWKPGEKIPSENELARLMGVSRVSVRSALEKLKSVGLVESRQGGGTFVCKADGSQYLNALIPMAMLESEGQEYVLEFRRIMECEQAYLAAQRASEEDIRLLRENLKKMKEKIYSGEEFVEVDLEFHMLLADACGNPLMSQTSKILRDVIRGNIEYTRLGRDRKSATIYHERLVEAIESRDAPLARQLMQEHMNVAEQDLSESISMMQQEKKKE